MPVGQSSNTFRILNASITAPGTAERLAAFYVPEGHIVNLTARDTNVGSMFLADTQAKAQSGARKVLIPGQATALRVSNTALIWVDAANANDVLEVTLEGETTGVNPG